MKQLTINLTENAHPHAEMITAKAADMSLAVFVKNSTSGTWYEAYTVDMLTHTDYDFFLCLPQHKEACLHWLNGGEVQVSNDGEKWEEYNLSVEYPKYPMTDFTGYEFQFRIKPKKEKRWIALRDFSLIDRHFATKKECVEYVDKEYLPSFARNCQYIEIEVEV